LADDAISANNLAYYVQRNITVAHLDDEGIKRVLMREWEHMRTIDAVARGYGGTALFSTFQFFDGEDRHHRLVNESLRTFFTANRLAYVDQEALIRTLTLRFSTTVPFHARGRREDGGKFLRLRRRASPAGELRLPSSRLRRFRVATVALSVGATLIAGEIAARLLSGSDASVAATDVARSLDYLRPCARVEERDGKRVLAIEQDGETTAVFPVDKAPSVLRIAVVGESTAAMLANALHDVLAQTGRADRVEVLPCAVPGAALEHVERRAAEVLDYSPDVLFVVFGHNLMIAYSTHDWLLRARALLSHSRLIAGLPGFRAGSHAWAPAQRERRIRELDGWLRELAGRARERGVAVASMTLTANLWFPPGGSHATLSDARFLAAILERAQGDGARATEALAALVEQQPEPYWQFVLGTWLAGAAT
jgi:hypothetical protein